MTEDSEKLDPVKTGRRPRGDVEIKTNPKDSEKLDPEPTPPNK